MVVIARAEAMVSDNCLEAVWCVGLVESVTVMLTVNVPPAAGVPAIVPAAGSMAIGEGSPVAVQDNGAVPLEAVTGAL